jgi:hypothetical protein
VSRHVRGQGNGPTRQKTLKANRRTREFVRTEDRRDIGNRPGVEVRLGIDGDREHIIDGVAVHPSRVFVELANHWLKRAA